MERENDIFEQPSKVQNMNFLFDDEPEAETAEEAPSVPASRKTRQASSDGSSVRRSRRTGASSSQRQRSSQNGRSGSSSARKAQSSGSQKTRSSQSGNAQNSRSSQQRPQRVNPTEAQKVQPRQVEARGIDSVTDSAAVPSQAQPKQVRTEDTTKPRQTRPTQAQPRQVRPSQSRSQASGRRSDSTRSSERINRSSSGRGYSSSRGTKRSRTKSSSGFKKFLLIYSAILLVILIVGLIIFGSFLKKLENSQPSNIAAEVADSLKADKASSFLKSNEEYINCFGEPDDLINQFAANMEGVSQVSFIENKDYRADAPSYNITADGNTVAKLTLEKTGSGSFGLSEWGIKTLDIADYMDTGSYEFLAPVGTTIKINGVELDEKYLTGEESKPQVLETASKYVNTPSYLTYKVAGIAGTPEIVATDANGNPLTITEADNKYVIGSATSQEFIDSVSPLVNNALEAWGKHFINMGGNLSAYMLEGSDWYSYIFGGPDMDPIYTAFYEYESIADYAFTEKNIGNFIRYTDDCFTVDVDYKMQVDFNTDQMSDNNQKLDATWVFITQNNGQDWYLVDCIYK